MMFANAAAPSNAGPEVGGTGCGSRAAGPCYRIELDGEVLDHG